MFEDTLTKKITKGTKVVDEWGNPLNANVLIDGIPSYQTNSDGTIVLYNVTDSAQIKFTHIGKASYQVSAIFLPAKVILREEAEELDGFTITIDKKTTTTTEASTTTEEKKPLNWLLWISLLGLGIQVKKYFDEKNKVVKAKI